MSRRSTRRASLSRIGLPRRSPRWGGTSYIFVTDGIEAALHRAQEAAGSQDMLVNGGADVARQFLNVGLLDQVRLHLVPVCWAPAPGCLTACARTSAWSRAKRSAAPLATHLTYDVERAP
jgi:dihydrofolate reductase